MTRIAEFPTLAQALQAKADAAGWRAMDCAPRRPEGSDDAAERILARTERDEDVEIEWSIAGEVGPNGWRRAVRPDQPVEGRLVAWRPIVAIGEPDERTMAASLARHARVEAEKAERMARFLPQERARAEALRADAARFSAIAAGRP